MGLKDTPRSLTPATGFHFTTGAGIVGPSGMQGDSFARRIDRAQRLAEKIARWQVDPAVAPDIAQQVAAEIIERVGKNATFLDGRKRKIPETIYGMVGRVVDRYHRGILRSSPREALYMEERAESLHVWMDPEARLSEEVTEEVHRRALERLTQAERKVLALHGEGLSYDEIAKRRGRKVSTVRGQIVRARAVYREECLAAGIEAPPPKDTSKRPPKPPASPTGGADEQS